MLYRTYLFVFAITVALLTGCATDSSRRPNFGFSYVVPSGWVLVDRLTLADDARGRKARSQRHNRSGVDPMVLWVTDPENTELLTRDGRIPDTLPGNDFIQLVRAPMSLPKDIYTTDHKEAKSFCLQMNQMKGRDVCVAAKSENSHPILVLDSDALAGMNQSKAVSGYKQKLVIFAPGAGIMIFYGNRSGVPADSDVVQLIRSIRPL